jgi:hypothetical protein
LVHLFCENNTRQLHAIPNEPTPAIHIAGVGDGGWMPPHPWSGERWLAIWKMNTGQYNGLLETYLKSQQ